MVCLTIFWLVINVNTLMGHHAFYWYWLLWSDFRHLTGIDSAYVSTMLNLYVLQYSVDHELNIEKKKERKKEKERFSGISYPSIYCRLTCLKWWWLVRKANRQYIVCEWLWLWFIKVILRCARNLVLLGNPTLPQAGLWLYHNISKVRQNLLGLKHEYHIF